MKRGAFLLLLPSLAFATPVELTYQARVLDLSGLPVNGSHSVMVGLYATQSGGGPAWSDTLPLTLEDGYLTLILGQDDSLQSELVAANPWVGLTVGSSVLPRQRIGSVPSAASAYSVAGSVQIQTTLACSSSTAGALKFETARLWLCDGVDYRPISFLIDGLTPVTAARDCKHLREVDPARVSGQYWVNPGSGPVADAFQAWCDMTTDGGGWTVIISQEAGQFSGDMKAHYGNAVPRPGVTAIASWWMQHDLKAAATQWRVSNTSGEVYTFATSDFTGPIIVDVDEDTRFVDAADTAWRGILYGDQPVVSHYQLGQVASSASYRAPAGHDSGASYFNGLGVVFDWNNNDSTTNVTQHAHFGGNSNLEGGWSRRGALWMIR